MHTTILHSLILNFLILKPLTLVLVVHYCRFAGVIVLEDGCVTTKLIRVKVYLLGLRMMYVILKPFCDVNESVC